MSWAYTRVRIWGPISTVAAKTAAVALGAAVGARAAPRSAVAPGRHT